MTENTMARIEGAKKKIETLNKKMERILAAKATDWEKNPYMYCERDIQSTEKEIKEAENRLAYWVGKGEDEDAKAAARNIEPILEFLDGWKDKVTKYYVGLFDIYYEESKVVRKASKKVEELRWGTPEYETAKAEYETLRKALYSKCHGYFEKKMVRSPHSWDKGKMIETEVKVREGELEDAVPYISGNDMTKAVEKLDKDLTAEYNRKYDNIVERASYYCGKIEDAAGLRVGQKGELDGIVVGNKGKCHIETIGAGGYNIQCFHFRVLVHEIKEVVKPVKAQKQPEPQKTEKKSDKKVDWKAYSEDDLIKMCGNLGIGIGHLISIEDTRIKRMRLVMAMKKFGMVGDEIAPNAFKDKVVTE